MKLCRIRLIGRFVLADGKEVNVHKGVRRDRGTDVYFYLYRQARQLLSCADVSAARRVS
jgi:hypothetical protein